MKMKRQSGWIFEITSNMAHRDTSDYLALKAFKWYNAAYANLDGSNANYVSALTKHLAIWALNIGWTDTILTDKRLS